MKVTERTPLPDGILGSREGDPATNDLHVSDFNRSSSTNLWPALGEVAIKPALIAKAAAKRPNTPAVLNGLSASII
ncbi:hypothetical protein [Hymenobacter glacieicola]|uniref:Uncharacterized protein n=1 Tax=Hymenobacter glacieicola TaxID=1562124 RepID=A0ABQ1X586_9BACT|nr:hypothetical protein [Hymenobacter glacieicola]GGG60593.1 hypothetical protein GCM10011378_40760 [Hymenobacter glacieicola]